MSLTPVKLDTLTAVDLEPFVGQSFEVAESALVPPIHQAEGALASLVLREVKAANHPTPGRQPFSLFFEGPPDVYLQDRIYQFSNASFGSMDIFIVPISGNAEGRTYQAVFN